MDAKEWIFIHNDLFHPGTREECPHCQEMIRLYGHMPTKNEILEALAEHNKQNQSYKKIKIPEDIRWEIWERDDFRCRHCGSRRYLRVDHILPESKGGTLDLDNLQTLCKSCNAKKGTKPNAK